MIEAHYTCIQPGKIPEIVGAMKRSGRYIVGEEYPELTDVQPHTWTFQPRGWKFLGGFVERPRIEIDREGYIKITAETVEGAQEEMSRLVERTGIGELPEQEVAGIGRISRSAIITSERFFPADLGQEAA